MAASMTAVCAMPVARVAQPTKASLSKAPLGMRAPLRVNKALAPAPRVVRPVVAQAMPQEVAQVAIEAGFIWSTAGICAAMTLIGVSIGFVLLRVESLVEEGKL